MAKLSFKQFFTKITPDQNIDVVKDKKKMSIPTKLLLYSADEIKALRDQTYTPKNFTKQTEPPLNLESIYKEFEALSGDVVSSRHHYQQLIKIEPKIEQAEDILIPSILSASSLKQYDVQFKFDETFPQDILESSEFYNLILANLNDYLNKDLNITNKLYRWTKEALMVTGAVPILIVPVSLVKNLRDSSISFENFIDDYEKDTLFISTEQLQKDIVDIDFEMISNSIVKTSSKLNNKYSPSFKKLVEYNFKTIVKESTQYIEVTDKIETLLTPIKKSSSKQKDFVSAYKKWYSDEKNEVDILGESFVNLGTYINDLGNDTLRPTILELPPESVVPILSKLNHTEHVGYLILLDKDGYPIKIEEEDNHNDPVSKHLDKLYDSSSTASACLSSFSSNIHKVDKYETTNKLYETYIEQLILSTAKNIGLYDISFDLKSSLTEIMLSRILKHKKTKILFVPKFMLTYYAFKYNKYGIGVSKISEISFILSLKLTYLMTRLYKMINESIDYKEVRVALNEKINNPIEFLQTLKTTLVQNKTLNLSHDPINILKSLSEKHISVIPENIPGIDSFSINSENIQKQHNLPDEGLDEIFDKMLTILLEVPPSTFNELSENEYARSLNTINMLFEIKMSKKRKLVIEHMNHLIKNYLIFDTSFQNNLKDHIEHQKIKGLSNKDISSLIMTIIKSITLYLPEPNISFDRTEFELASEYVSFVKELFDELYPQELIANSENRDFFETMIAYIKSNMIKKYLTKSNLVVHFDKIFKDFKEFDISDMVDVESQIANYKKALDGYNEKIAKSEDSY